MAGLVPAIHVLLSNATKKDVDARDKRGHDEYGARSVAIYPTLLANRARCVNALDSLTMASAY